MTISLEGKSVLIIGGAKRIGRAVALECARSGAHVAFTYHTSNEEADEALAELRAIVPSQRFAAYPLEVSDASAWAALSKRIEGDFGPLFGLVFCAAIFERTPLSTLGEDDFDRHIATNLKGPFLGCQTFGSRLEEGGAIVLFSDIYATRPLLNYIPYCASKAGVEMLCKGFAKALAPRGVRVNCLAPGAILPGEGDEESAAQLLARVPLGRLGGAEEVAKTAVFLLNGSEFLTGIVVPLEGGQLLR